MGTGNIAGQFAADVSGASRSQLAAVGSRRIEAAEAFAQRYHIPRAHGSYEGLLADASVEAIYLSLPNSLHHAWTLKALAAGKHVLCEKPLAVNEVQAQEMFDVARARGLLLTEAFMYRSHPLTRAVLAELPQIGPVKLIRASFCYRMNNIHGNIRFSKELAGGALMDIGCYCVSFSRLIAGGEPNAVHCVGHLHETGVDDYAAGVMHFGNDVLATFTCGMTVQGDNTASICGEGGYIEIPVPWKPARARAPFTVGQSAPPKIDQPRNATPPQPQTFFVDAGKPLYALEADDFAAAVLEGAKPAVSETDTLGNMRVLDEMRKQVGVGEVQSAKFKVQS
jgi:predicted dehydrogenase